MRRLLLTVLVGATLTGCGQPADSPPAGAVEAAPTSTTTAPPATTMKSAAETERVFHEAAFQAVLPVGTLRTADVEMHEERLESGPVISCWARLRTPHLVGYLRRWESAPSLVTSTAHLYPSRRAEELITELREQTTQHCPEWQDEEEGAFKVIGEHRIPVTSKVDGVFAFCASNKKANTQETLYCFAYLARNGPGTTMLSTVGVTMPMVKVKGSKDHGALAKIILRGLAHTADTLLSRLTLP
ncbi:hypothetical protein M8C13_06480 [Crossiella sp. SN42]|uniref:hypothetical protein n=1 Tax=Crossiella sp. SN42 TaxID=2944808 RepID=UPI00207CD11D|nr:hypothetical protein [Crossiella sp. SN42]MCO1575406.1 hypothetical protein [Crossiella sp. SN42]